MKNAIRGYTVNVIETKTVSLFWPMFTWEARKSISIHPQYTERRKQDLANFITGKDSDMGSITKARGLGEVVYDMSVRTGI